MPLSDRPPKDPLGRWRAASWLLGVPVLIEVLALVSGDRLNVGLPGTLLLMALLGIAMSVPDGLEWLRGREPHQVRRRGLDVEVLPRADPGPAYVVIENRSSSYRGLRPRELRPLWYVLYVVLVRAPQDVGDLLLTLLWRGIARGAGRRRDVSRAEPLEERLGRGDPDQLPPPSEF